jgi:DNA/RNA endonuclease YhcR with UshA esterase domain
MRNAGFAVFLIVAAVPARAETIRAEDAIDHVGESATVAGRVSITRMASGEIYLDLDGSGDGAPLSAYVSRWNAARFPGIGNLNGRTIEITGTIGSFRYRPEIFLTNPSQIAATE